MKSKENDDGNSSGQKDERGIRIHAPGRDRAETPVKTQPQRNKVCCTNSHIIINSHEHRDNLPMLDVPHPRLGITFFLQRNRNPRLILLFIGFSNALCSYHIFSVNLFA